MSPDRAVVARLRSLVSHYELPPPAEDRLARLLNALEDAAAPTAVHDPRVGVEQHVADSLVALDLPEVRSAKLIADLGAGAGLPGLVLAIALPRTQVALVESASRKCRFLERTAQHLEVDGATVVCSRIESWDDGRERCDVVCARALASLPVLCEYAAPLLVDGGLLVAWKAEVEPPEAEAAEAASARLGLAADGVRPVQPFPAARHRTLHLYRKVAPTPPGFPRRPGIAIKRPISANP